jgi:hypothetical protein
MEGSIGVMRLALITESVRGEVAMKQWACLAAGVSVLAACVGQSPGDPPGASPAADPGIEAAPDEIWAPLAGPDGTPDGSADVPRSDMAAAIDSVPSARETGPDKSYLIPAAEILGFQFLLNQFDRHSDEDVYGTNGTSIRDNLHRGWVVDEDPFSTNQFAHPYSGSIYHGFARSAGLNYWESLGYDFAASAVWEVAGETDPPSLNDQITTTFAGSFLGEALFRTANYVLASGDGKPGTIRSVSAFLIAPSAGVNRLAFCDRFDAANPSNDPPVFYWLGVGARRNTTLNDAAAVTNIGKDHAVAAFAIDYGMPGKPGYTHDRPFDYFHFEATAVSSGHAIPENIMVRGLLYGTDYSWGPDYRAIWGLYGTYDYFSPEVFKVSSTGLAVGTTAQYLMSKKFALQGSLLGGAGYTAAGTSDSVDGVHEFRYGASPQALVAARLIYDDVAMLGFTVNDYFLSGGTGSGDTSGSENILRAQASLTVRVYGQHAIGVAYIQSSRDPRSSGISDTRQSVGALSLYYTFLGDEHFGALRR